VVDAVLLVLGAIDPEATFSIADELRILPVLSQAFTNRVCVPAFTVIWMSRLLALVL
jgi:hypothetical protein